MFVTLIANLIVLLIPAVFMILGIKKGFVRTLCSLLAVFVALIGAYYAAKGLSSVAVELIGPHMSDAIAEKLQNWPALSGTNALSSDKLVPFLQEMGLSENLARTIQNKLIASGGNLTVSLNQLLADSVVRVIVFSVLFLLTFVILLVLWFLLSRVLDLMARLPVLNFLNRTLGGILGLAQGLILLLLLRWTLCDLLPLIPSTLVDQTWLLQLISVITPLSFLKIPVI